MNGTTIRPCSPDDVDEPVDHSRSVAAGLAIGYCDYAAARLIPENRYPMPARRGAFSSLGFNDWG